MKKFLTLLMVVLMVALTVAPAFATGGESYDYGTDGEEATGLVTKLHKYLVVDKDTNSPAITFNYTIAAGTAVAADNGTLPVYAGLEPANVKIGDAAGDTDGKVAFAYGAAITAGAANDNITNSADKKYGAKDIILDFSAITFDKPGVYRYILTEAASNDQSIGGVIYDVNGDTTNRARTIDVYVDDIGEATPGSGARLAVVGFVSYLGSAITTAPAQSYDPAQTAMGEYANGSIAADATGIGAKSNQYVNEIEANILTLEKEITGNQGDKESEWEMTVKFETLPAGYTVKYALITDKGADIPAASLVWADYTNEAGITVGHLDKYMFKGIPEGVKYTVTETLANSSGYTTTYTNSTYTFTNDGTVETKAAKVENHREGVIPTGILMSVTGGIVLVVIGAAALIILNRRKAEDEE